MTARRRLLLARTLFAAACVAGICTLRHEPSRAERRESEGGSAGSPVARTPSSATVLRTPRPWERTDIAPIEPAINPGPRLAEAKPAPPVENAKPQTPNAKPQTATEEDAAPLPLAPLLAMPPEFQAALARLRGVHFSPRLRGLWQAEDDATELPVVSASASGEPPRAARRWIDEPLRHNAPEFFTAPGTRTIFLAGVSGAGSFTGAGEVAFAASYSPGNSPAIVTLSSQVIFTSTNVLTMEIGGLTPGPGTPADNGYDQLIFTSAATPQVTWGGTFVVDLINNFAPQPGQAFNLFDFDSARDAAAFATITIQDHGWLAPGLSFDFSQIYVTGVITVAPEPGAFALLAVGSLALARRRRV